MVKFFRKTIINLSYCMYIFIIFSLNTSTVNQECYTKTTIKISQKTFRIALSGVDSIINSSCEFNTQNTDDLRTTKPSTSYRISSFQDIICFTPIANLKNMVCIFPGPAVITNSPAEGFDIDILKIPKILS